MPAPAPPPDASLRRLGRYTILEDLAKGGMAQVFIAQKDNAPEICVLKQLLGELESHATAGKRFYREAHVASYLTHRRIARTIDAGFEDGTFCIAMEFIAGRDVESMMHLLMRQGRMLPYELSLSVALGVLEGLEYAHDARDPLGAPLDLVHRDLSPRNVMLSFDGEVKVIDFGLARGKVDDFKTAPGMILGTLRYVSPEQAVADPIDRRSDLYSIAVVLYEMLTGRPLVRDGKALDVLTDVVQRVPERLSVRNPHLPVALDEVLARALEKKPEDRYQTARELREALEHAAGELARTPRAAIGEFVTGLFPKEREKALSLIERGRRRYLEGRHRTPSNDADRTLAPRDLTAPDDPGSRTRTGFVDTDELGSRTRTGFVEVDDLGSRTRTAFLDAQVDPLAATRVPGFEATQLAHDTFSDQPLMPDQIVDPTRMMPFDGPPDMGTRTVAMPGTMMTPAPGMLLAPPPPEPKALRIVGGAAVGALVAGALLFWLWTARAPEQVEVLEPITPPEATAQIVGATPGAVAGASPAATAAPQAAATKRPSPAASSPAPTPRRAAEAATPAPSSPSPPPSRTPGSDRASGVEGLRAQVKQLQSNWDSIAPHTRFARLDELGRDVRAKAPASLAPRIDQLLADSNISGDEKDIERLYRALDMIEKSGTP